MRQQITGIAGAVLLLAGIVQAEIVVSAGRVPTAAEDVSSSVTSLSGADLERLQVTTLPQAVSMVPGVHMVRSGGPGQTADIYIRGSKPDHILVLVDGMEMNDPSLVGRNADLSTLDVADIERIEVLRGAQSALYGADAMGGVINIITKRGSGPPTVTLSAEAGTFETYRETVTVSGGTGIVDYAFTVTHIETEGFSAANEADGNTEADGYERTGLSGRIGITPSEHLSFDLLARYSHSSVDYDNGAGEGADAPDNVAEAERLFLGGTAKLGLLDSTWQQRLTASVSEQRRDFMSSWGDNWFDSELTKVGWQHDLYQGDVNVVSAGVEVEEETAETDSLLKLDSEIKSLYVQDQVRLGGVTLVGGLRLDDHDTFGEEVTGRVGVNVRLMDDEECGLRLKSTYGTGFKAPSLYQLHAPSSTFGPIGNEELQPETSRSVDAGIELCLADNRVQLDLTGFQSEYEDLIDFVAGYVNQSEADIRGAELTARVKVCEAMSVGATYTYTDSEDAEGNTLSRRPRHRATADIHYAIGEDVNLSLTCVYVGEREDSYFSSTDYVSVSEQLPDHTVVNLAASWDLCETVTLFGRVENLFDEAYEELAGYGTAGISGYGGLRVTL